MNEVITIKDTTANMPRSLRAYKVGNLAVANLGGGVHKVYIIRNGKPFIDVSFSNSEDGIKFAQWLDDTFSEYFVLLDEYPNMDLPKICKWSVSNGIQLYEAIEILKKQKQAVDLEFVATTYKSVSGKVKEWVRQ